MRAAHQPTAPARWRVMVAALLGHPMPQLPQLPGRVHALADEPLPADEVAEAVAAGCTAAELAALLCCSRPTAAATLARLRAEKGNP